MQEKIDGLFDMLQKNNISYVVLRGYTGEREIYESEDIDLLISDNDFTRFDELMISNNWFTPKFNLNKMFHKQYFSFERKKRIKIDVVNRLNFGEKHREIKELDSLLSYREKYKNRNFYTLNPTDSLVVFLLHLIYDKGKISEENGKRLYKMYQESLDYPQGKFSISFNKFSFENLRDLDYMEKMLLKEVFFSSSSIQYIVYKVRFLFRKIISETWCLGKKKTVSIIGVDGTGKSTTISLLQDLLGSHCTVQYMGFTRYKTIFARRYNGRSSKGKIANFIETFCVYLEMWARYLDKRFIRHKIILFDRFVNESYINANGLRKIMTIFLFQILFPKPKSYYYLYCPIETSLSRKDDITDIAHFIDIKNRFDKYYLNMKNVKKFDTSIMDSQEIAEEIYLDISKNFPDFLV